MVSKTDLLKKLEEKSVQVVPLEKYQDGSLTYQFYRYYWVDGEVIRSQACCIVEDPEKNAYFKDAIPSILVPRVPRFIEEVEAELERSTINLYEVERVAENRKIAIVTVYSKDTEGIRSTKYLVWKDRENKWHREKLV